MDLLFDKIVSGEFQTLLDARLGDQGLPLLQFLYGEYWRGQDGRIDFELVQSKLPELVASLQNDLLCINVEGPSWNGLWSSCTEPSDWARDANEIRELTRLIRREAPDIRLGFYGSFPNLTARHINGHHASRDPGANGDQWRAYLNARRLMEFQRSVAKQLDFYCPSLYWTTEDWHWPHERAQWAEDRFTDEFGHISPLFESQNTAMAYWRTTRTYGLQLVRELLPYKPLIPILSVQWITPESGGRHDCPAREELVFPSWVLKSLDAIKPYCDSAAFWIWPNGIGGFALEHYFASAGWRAIREWAESP